MTLFVPANHWQCKLRWSLSGDPQEMISTIGVRGADTDDRDAVGVAEGVAEAWRGAWADSGLNNAYTFKGCDVTEGSVEGDGIAASFDLNAQGGGQFSIPSSNCALLVKKRTLLGGRMNVGRMFLPAGYMSEQAVGPTGQILQVDLTTFQNNMNQFFENLTDAEVVVGQPMADFVPVIFHTDPARSPTPITHFAVDGMIATQRQRMRR